MMSVSREMTLAEYMAVLPDSHRANKELASLRAALAKAEQERDAAVERAKMYNNDMEMVRKQRDAAVQRAEAAEARPCVEHCREERAMGNGGCGACSMCCREMQERAENAEAVAKRRGDFLMKIKEKLGELRLSFDAPITGRQIFAVQTAFDLACERAELDTGTVTMPCDPPVEPDPRTAELEAQPATLRPIADHIKSSNDLSDDCPVEFAILLGERDKQIADAKALLQKARPLLRDRNIYNDGYTDQWVCSNCRKPQDTHTDDCFVAAIDDFIGLSKSGNSRDNEIRD